MNPDASGNATRWHGYVAREGFGITRIKNHISDKIPAAGNIHFSRRFRLFQLRNLLVLGQFGSTCFFDDCISLPP
jgi:hypothetical protein